MMNSPNLARLAAYQKRLLNWRNYNSSEVKDSNIKSDTSKLISRFSELLMQCWEEKALSKEDEFKIMDLERQLEQLNEEARLSNSDKSIK